MVFFKIVYHADYSKVNCFEGNWDAALPRGTLKTRTAMRFDTSC